MQNLHTFDTKKPNMLFSVKGLTLNLTEYAEFAHFDTKKFLSISIS